MANPKQIYVKFETLISGTTPLYLSTGALSGSPANAYSLLDLSGMARGGQSVEPLTGRNNFPSFSFRLLDDKRDPHSTYEATDTGTLLKLLYQNSSYIYNTLVSVWEGDSQTAYGSFTEIYQGYVNTWAREDGGFTFELMPALKKLENPIVFPTGSFQVQTAFTAYASGNKNNNILLKNSVNLTPGTRTNLLGASTAWTMVAGNMTGSPGNVLTNNNNGLSTYYTDITIGSAAGNSKLGVCYTFYATLAANINSDGTTLQLTASGYNGATLVDSQTSTQDIADGATGGLMRTGVMYIATDPTVTKIRLQFTVDNTNAFNLTNSIVTLYYSVSNSWIIGRELIDILSYTASTGKAQTAARGGLGSIPTYHDVGEQGLRCTILGGHPNDIARRLILSTSNASPTNQYDAGDGLGLGAEIPFSLIDGSWDTERNFIRTGTLYGAWVSGTAYVKRQVVSENGSNWLCWSPTLAPHTTAPHLAPQFWQQIGNQFDGEDYSHYKMLFFITQKIPNLLTWLQDEICKPLHANLYMTYSGTLGIKYWRAIETAGGTTLTDSQIIVDQTGEVPMTFDREQNLVNQVTYRMDYDELSGLDIQGNQAGGKVKFIREFVLTEKTYGQDSTTASSAALNGVRESAIESKGLRGAASTRFGVAFPLGGDQTAFEVGRRIITRHYQPLAIYTVKAAYSARTLKIGDVVPVTCAEMVNLSAGTWGRTSANMLVISHETDYEAGEVTLGLLSIADAVTIPDTTVDAAPTAPVDADISTLAKQASLTVTQQQDLPIYPKDYANCVFVTLNGAKANDYLVFAYNSSTNSAPADSSLQLVGEIPAGQTLFFYLAHGQNASTYTWVKVSARNPDRGESIMNPTQKAYTVPAADGMGVNRGTKLETMQLAGSPGWGGDPIGK